MNQSNPNNISTLKNLGFSLLKQKYGLSMKKLFHEFQKQKQLFLQLSKIVQIDQNQLTKCQDMRIYVRNLYSIDPNYITIVPYIFIKYMLQNSKKQFTDINKYLLTQIEYFGDRYIRKQIKQIKEEENITLGLPQQYIKKLKRYYNLFVQKTCFGNIQQLIQQIDKVSNKCKTYMTQFTQLTEKISLQNKGKGFKANTKMPVTDTPLKKFRNYIRVIQRIFQKQFQQQNYQQIFIKKIQQTLKQFKGQNISEIGLLFMESMIQVVELILKQKKQKNIPIDCFIPDFIRANAFFERKKNLVEAAKDMIKQCEKRKYEIIFVTERVGRGAHEIVFRIKINDCIAEFQLVQSREDIQIDLQTREYIHSLYQIRRSPLGVMFGCFLLLSKYQHLLFLDVACQILKTQQKDQLRKVVSNFISTIPFKNSQKPILS